MYVREKKWCVFFCLLYALCVHNQFIPKLNQSSHKSLHNTQHSHTQTERYRYSRIWTTEKKEATEWAGSDHRIRDKEYEMGDIMIHVNINRHRSVSIVWHFIMKICWWICMCIGIMSILELCILVASDFISLHYLNGRFSHSQTIFFSSSHSLCMGGMDVLW